MGGDNWMGAVIEKYALYYRKFLPENSEGADMLSQSMHILKHLETDIGAAIRNSILLKLSSHF